jgi:hypothetical protein
MTLFPPRAGALLGQKISSQVSMAFPPRAGRERHGAGAHSQPRGAHE